MDVLTKNNNTGSLFMVWFAMWIIVNEHQLLKFVTIYFPFFIERGRHRKRNTILEHCLDKTGGFRTV